MEGILPILKPAGMTSHDVVAKARRILKQKRIGHTGTLDPQVTGVLPLCIGRATRMVEYIQELPKEYVAELTIGYRTDTEDATGEVLERVQDVSVNESQIQAVLNSFIGTIEQVPPMYSAVKIQGKRLYELAREGKEVERKAREVTIYELEALEINLGLSYPTLKLRVLCSKGTYIRTLCSDIGKALGYPAVMSSLVRTKTGPLRMDQCFTLEQVAQLMEEGRMHEVLIPSDQGVKHLSEAYVAEPQARKALLGQKLKLSELDIGTIQDEAMIRLYAENGQFLGLFQLKLGLSQVHPVKVFN